MEDWLLVDNGKPLKILQFNANIAIGLKARKTGFFVTFPVTCDVEVRTRNPFEINRRTKFSPSCLMVACVKKNFEIS